MRDSILTLLEGMLAAESNDNYRMNTHYGRYSALYLHLGSSSMYDNPGSIDSRPQVLPAH
jgi:hypothetical protein